MMSFNLNYITSKTHSRVLKIHTLIKYKIGRINIMISKETEKSLKYKLQKMLNKFQISMKTSKSNMTGLKR